MYSMKEVTITELRRNIFQLIDEALATGEPLVIRRKGRRVVMRRDPSEPPQIAETETERRERWRRFWSTPSPIKEDLSLEDIEAAGEAYWRWNEEPEPDR
jgi:antitoxin (DNA-binding transcriptional repressor) of toxin-antitoxin stability system